MGWPVLCVIVIKALQLLPSKPLSFFKRIQVVALKNQQQRTVKPFFFGQLMRPCYKTLHNSHKISRGVVLAHEPEQQCFRFPCMAGKQAGEFFVIKPCSDVTKCVHRPVSYRADVAGITAYHHQVRLSDDGSVPEKRTFHDNPSVNFSGRIIHPHRAVEKRIKLALNVSKTHLRIPDVVTPSLCTAGF